MKKQLGTITALLFALAGLAQGQDQGMDNVSEKGAPGLHSSVLDRMRQLAPGFHTQAISSCSFGSLTIGVPVTGQLDSSDCDLGSPVYEYADFWVFSGAGGQSVTVSVTSAALSPLLATIQDYSDGTVLASGNGSSPVVFSYVLPTATNYVVGITSLKGTYSTGPYTLLVTGSSNGGGGVNLEPFSPSGWSGPIVVSTATRTNLDASVVRDTDEVFVDYAICNSGSGAIAVPFVNELYLDGVLKRQGTVQGGMSTGYYVYLEDYSLGRLSAGTHTLRLKADAGNAVQESDETDNEYLKTFVVQQTSGTQACTTTSSNLCLSANRFKVEATWVTSTSQGSGTAIPLTADSGYFWFFNPENVELIVKVLDACSFDPHKWVFAAGLTNVEVTMTVTDTKTGIVRTYRNPLNTTFQTVTDTAAFSTCP